MTPPSPKKTSSVIVLVCHLMCPLVTSTATALPRKLQHVYAWPRMAARPLYSSCDETPMKRVFVVSSRTGDPAMTEARWLSRSVTHLTAAVSWSMATRYEPAPGWMMTFGGSRSVPKMTIPPVTRGVPREAQPPSEPG